MRCFLTSSVWKDSSAEASQPYRPVVNRLTSDRVTLTPTTWWPVPFRVTSCERRRRSGWEKFWGMCLRAAAATLATIIQYVEKANTVR